MTSAASAAALAWPLDGAAFDMVVYSAGVYGPRHDGLEPPTQDEFDAVMHTNVLGAMRVLPPLVELLAPGARLALMSSRMGSIAGRSGHHGWLYRASKAALNSVLKDAVAGARRPRHLRGAAPGLGADRHGRRGGAARMSHDSVAGIRRTLAALAADDNGRFLRPRRHAVALVTRG